MPHQTETTVSVLRSLEPPDATEAQLKQLPFHIGVNEQPLLKTQDGGGVTIKTAH